MKFPRLLLVAALFSGSGCERVRLFTGKYLEKTKPPAAVKVTEPLVTEISEPEALSQTRGKVVIIEYHAVWNGQSHQLAPLLEAVAGENGGKVVVGKLDVDKYGRVATSMGVKTLPDLRIYQDGKFVEKYVGLPDKEELREKVAKYLVDMPSPADLQKRSSPGKPLAKPMREDWMPEGMRRR